VRQLWRALGGDGCSRLYDVRGDKSHRCKYTSAMKTAPPERRRERFDCERCGNPSDAFPGTNRATRKLCRACYGKRADRRPRELNDLTGKEWAQASRSVQAYPDTRSEKQRLHGAAFPMSLARQQISSYTKAGEVVLDPFVGVGTTLDACSELDRHGIGIELNEEYAKLAAADIAGDGRQQLIVGDALRLLEYVDPETADFLLTSPPYGALLKSVKGAFAYKWQEHSNIAPIRNPVPYSTHPQDLGNMSYPDYLDALTTCLEQIAKALKDDAYAVWVVKDFRALKENIPYVPFHVHLIERAEASGFTLWDIQIYDQTKFRPLVCLGYPSRNFYLNIGHSYLIILRKRQ
jgi:DNA modification methylase